MPITVLDDMGIALLRFLFLLLIYSFISGCAGSLLLRVGVP